MEQNQAAVLTKAALAAVDTGEYDIERSFKELEELAITAGCETVLKISQKRDSYDTATCIGEGKLLELAEASKAENIELIIFDCELSGVQMRNIEKITDIRVIDRTSLILDIFAGRARTSEGRLQVELALQKYRLPRLTGKGIELSRQGGGIGTRGPGETKLETDRRHIRRRIEKLEEELRELKVRRDLHRQKRKKDSILTAAIVGYTNAGKSTLLNSLTGAGVLAEDKLFATLDITSRGIILPDGRNLIIADTVGLISRLPHHLVEAFKSTLEEASNADIIIKLIDLSAPDGEEQAKVTEELLSELGCGDIPQINVLNKCDRVHGSESIKCDSKTVKISAKFQTGFDELLECIAKNLPASAIRGRFMIPYEKTGLLNKIRADGKIFSEEHSETGTLIDASVDIKAYHLVDEYKI